MSFVLDEYEKSVLSEKEIKIKKGKIVVDKNLKMFRLMDRIEFIYCKYSYKDITEDDIQSGNDVNSIMRDMMSVLLEGALDEELNEELGYSKYDYRNKETDNSRNGHSKKTMRTSYGDMDVAIPRDRKGEYEPQLISKYQNTVTQDMEEKIISMYAKGMTTGDIEAHLKELYDLDISDSTISRITDKIMPIVKEWQERSLQKIYAVVYMDAIHYHVRSEGRIVKRAVYIALGIDMDGKKDVIGMYVGENEGAKFWLSIINGLKNRGVQDILIACVDGLNGFPQAIEAVYPKTEIPAVYHPPDPEYHELCILQRSEKTYGRFKNGLCSSR